MSPAPAAPERPTVRLAEINVNQATFDEKIIGVFRFEADARGKKGPALILLVEIASSLYVYEQLLDALCAAAERTRQFMSAVDTDPMIRFEKMTEQLNQAVATFVKSEPTPLSWNRINIFALEVSEHGVCLTGVGRMSNLFLQKQANGSHRSFDLFNSLEQPAEIDPLKPFASFICGDFHPGDVFFAGTGNFERLRQELGLKERLLAAPPVTVALDLKQELERRRIPDHFSGLVVSNILQAVSAVPVVEKVVSETKTEAARSVIELHEERMETEAYVESTVSPLSASGGAFAKAVKNRFIEAKSAINERLKKKPAPVVAQQPITDPLTLASLRGMSDGHGASLTSATKRKMIFAGIGVIVLIGGGLWIRQARRASAEQALWNVVYNQAVDKQMRADGDLIYQNDTGARQLIKEAVALAKGLDTKTAERKAAKEKLEQDLLAIQIRLRKEKRVDQPVIAYQATEGTVGPLSFGDSGLALVAIGSTSTNMVVMADGSPTASIPLPQEATPVVSLVTLKSGILALTPQKQLALVSLSKKTAGIVSFTTNGAGTTQSMSLYNGRLYVLDTANQTIWRYSPIGSGFGQETAYLKTPSADLAQGLSLAIDSNVYAGLSDGRLLKFLSGAPVAWESTLVDPALSEVTSIWTSVDGERIVVLDAKSKRVIVYDKNGKLLSQLVSATFQQPTSMTVDPKGKKIYVSDQAKVLQFDLP